MEIFTSLDRYEGLLDKDIELHKAAQELNTEGIDAALSTGADLLSLDNWGYGIVADSVEAFCRRQPESNTIDNVAEYIWNIAPPDPRPENLAQDKEEQSKDIAFFIPCLTNPLAVNPISIAVSCLSCCELQNIMQCFLLGDGINTPGRALSGIKRYNNTPAMYARSREVLMLLAGTKKLDYSIADDNGNTALHYQVLVCTDDDVDAAEFIIDNSTSDINARNKDGLTPLLLLFRCHAKANMHNRTRKASNMLLLLSEKGADMHISDHLGRDMAWHIISCLEFFLHNRLKMKNNLKEFLQLGKKLYYTVDN